MIQVANPNPIDRGSNIMYVFRPWTREEARKAVDGVPSPQEDPEEWVTGIKDIIHSYRLNGHEAGEAVQCSLGKDWARVRGN